VLLSPLVAACPSDKPEKDMSLLHSLYGWGVVSVVILSTIYFSIFTTQKWMYLAFFFAVLAIVGSVLFTLSPIPEMDVSSPSKKSGTNFSGLILCFLCIFLGGAAENTMTNWISSFMETALNIPKSIGDVAGLALFALLLATTRVLYAKFTPNISKTLLVGMIGASACYIIIGLSPSPILAFITCVLLGVFVSMLWPGTLILMEEKIPTVGVTAYALMATGGDLGSSVAPQLMGVIVDKVSVSSFALDMSATLGITASEFAMKFGMLLSSIFPVLGIIVVLITIKFFKKSHVQGKGQ
jgi:MFS family permease